MHQRLFIAGIISSVSIYALSTDILQQAALFVLVGIIPGIDYSIPSSVMLLATITCMWFMLITLFFRLAPSPVARKTPKTSATTGKASTPAPRLRRSYRSA